jgi:hypothetical protein
LRIWDEDYEMFVSLGSGSGCILREARAGVHRASGIVLDAETRSPRRFWGFAARPMPRWKGDQARPKVDDRGGEGDL